MFYEQVNGIAMGSPLLPVVANFYMEAFEHLALECASLKPLVFKRYIDVLCSSAAWTELDEFFSHLNSRHPNIEFTMQLES